MINNPKTLYLINVCVAISIVNGQGQDNNGGIALAPDFVAEKVSDMIASPRGSMWVAFRSDSRISPTDIFSQHGNSFLLSSKDDMILTRSEADNLGYTHYRYQQTYKGIKVEGAEMLVHSRGGDAERLNGNIVANLDLGIQPAILSEVALEAALTAVDAEIYMWEIPEMERQLQEIENDPNATYYPAVELVIARTSGSDALIAEKYRLAYKIPIYSMEPFGGLAVYVDALSGEVFRTLSLVSSSSQEASGTTLYNGTQTFITRYRPSPDNDYILADDSRGAVISTYKYLAEPPFITDTDTIWNAAAQGPGVSAHWAAEMTYDYYLATYNRDSYDDNGRFISVYTEMDVDNAYWTGAAILLGDGGGGEASDDLVSLDILGHEFSHAVDQHSNNLEYEYESGALDESFADISGTMVEFYAVGASGNYQIGEDFWIEDGMLRDMSDPHFKDHPDTYGTEDDNWFDVETCSSPNPVTNDNCGVHTNSGVQNYWFYLLAEGGTGTNENSDSYSVTAIGRTKAAAIAYRNLTKYLVSTSDYADAREGAIWAASDLYGENEVTQVQNAWYAVGVGPSMPYDIALQNETVSNDTLIYVAGNDITAGPAYVIQSGQVLFLANNSITLKPGFYAKAGSEFVAYVGDLTTPSPPSAPYDLIVWNLTENDSAPHLIWVGSASATSFNVYRQYDGSAFSLIASPTTNTYTDEGAGLDDLSSKDLGYKVTAVNVWGESGFSNTVSAGGYLSKEKPGVPSVYALHPAYPNPFNPTATIRYDLPEPADVQLVVYNLLGREVIRLVNAHMDAGYQATLWRGRDATGRRVPSGLYIARLVTPHFAKSIKMVLLK